MFLQVLKTVMKMCNSVVLKYCRSIILNIYSAHSIEKILFTVQTLRKLLYKLVTIDTAFEETLMKSSLNRTLIGIVSSVLILFANAKAI